MVFDCRKSAPFCSQKAVNTEMAAYGEAREHRFIITYLPTTTAGIRGLGSLFQRTLYLISLISEIM